MHILFRFDSGGLVGSGHLSRCSLLAEQAKKRGHLITLATRSIANGTLSGKPSFEITDEETEILKQLVYGKPSIDWVILDHYGYSEGMIARLRKALNTRICVLDDHLNRSTADLRWAPFSKTCHPNTLVGDQYAIIHPCFLAPIEDTIFQIPTTAYNLVCFGAADPKCLTRSCIENISVNKITTEKAGWVFIVNEQMYHTQALEEFHDEEHITFYKSIPQSHLCELMINAQFTIVSTSTLAIEALASGANLVGLHYMDNQDNIAGWLSSKGIPIFTEISPLLDTLENLTKTPAVLHQLDDKGPERLLSYMESFK